jgi:hypothetical protein
MKKLDAIQPRWPRAKVMHQRPCEDHVRPGFDAHYAIVFPIRRVGRAEACGGTGPDPRSEHRGDRGGNEQARA